MRGDIERVEAQVFSDHIGASRRIYALSREVREFQRATQPLTGLLERLIEGGEREDIDPMALRSTCATSSTTPRK